MSSPDYAQKLTDHQSFLVLVKPLGRRIGASDYGRIYEKIRSVQRICIPADPRYMMLRYKHEYRPEDNEWGDFQFHRRVLGLLCIVQYHADNPLHEVEAHYNSIKSLYGSSLFDSRLILLGVASADDLPSGTAVAGGSFSGDLHMKADHFGKPNDASAAVDASSALQQDASDPDLPQTEVVVRHRKLLSDVTEKQLLCYESAEVCLECIADDIRDFACSLFYILDSKRISASKLQVERQPQLLMAPYERRDVAHLDMESKLFKKRYIGRQKKHLGDLCLLAALYNEAGSNYSMALDILKSADDFLWVAGALEGLCCAAFFVNYPSVPEKSPMQLPRNRSFSTKRGPGNLFQNFGLKPSGSSTGVMESVGLDLAGPKLRNIFLAEEIGERYREAIQQYSKFRPAATVLELEACIKASRILILQGKRLEVCEFLQRVACVNLDFHNEEKIARWSALADLYGEIGFLRKAAFYKRSAAMECVLSCLESAQPLPSHGSSSMPTPRAIWQQCHAMLLQSFPGYKLSLHLKDYDSPTMVGWPALRHCVFSELIQAALEIGDCQASIEYLCTAMHVLFEHLSPGQLKQMSTLIEANSAHLAEELKSVQAGLGAPQPSAGVLGPNVAAVAVQPTCFSFTKIPVLCEVKVERLPPHMTPVRRQTDQASSVFIYTPLDKGPGRRRQKKGPVCTGLTWVEGDFSEVELYMHNPMPFELKLTNIGLVTGGVDFESHPSGHSLPADSGPHLIKVVGTPKSNGTLIIKGYTCSLLGVNSICLFSDLPQLKEATDGGYSVDVSPSLPRLHVSECGGLPRSPYLVTGGNSELHTSAVLRLLYGERKECLFRLRNVGGEMVESLDLTLDGKHRAGGGQRLLQWDASAISSQLPIALGDEAVLTIVADTGYVDPTDAASWSAVPLQPNERNPSSTPRERTDSRSSSSLLECMLKLKYSGGRGMASGYYRQCAMAIDVVLDPSLDVLSKQIVSNSVHEFTLVLNVVNRSNVTIDLRPPSQSSVCLRPMDATSISLAGTKCDFFATDVEVREYLMSLLQIRWSSPTAEGGLPSAHLRWSADELAAARRPAALLDVGFAVSNGMVMTDSANGAATGGEEVARCFGVGTAVGIVVELRNHCSQALSNVKVKMDVHQSVVARSGTTPVVPSAIDSGFCVLLEQATIQVKRCDSGSRHAAIKTLVAFYPGKYVLHAMCLSSSDVVLCKSSGLDFSID